MNDTTQNCVENALGALDCISRQAVLDALYALCDTGETLRENPWRDNPHIDVITDAINNLQSVNPQENERNCVTCKWSKDGHNAGTEECHLCMWESQYKPKTGRWIKYCIPRCGEQHYKCTSCGYYINFGQWGELYTKEFKYCPNCGAKMVEPQESKKVNCKSTKCENCINHNYCDYEPQESEEV